MHLYLKTKDNLEVVNVIFNTYINISTMLFYIIYTTICYKVFWKYTAWFQKA